MRTRLLVLFLLASPVGQAFAQCVAHQKGVWYALVGAGGSVTQFACLPATTNRFSFRTPVKYPSRGTEYVYKQSR